MRVRTHGCVLHGHVMSVAGGGGRGPYAGTHLDDVSIGAALMRLVVLGVLEQHLVHVGAGILEQLVGVVEDDERNLAVA